MSEVRIFLGAPLLLSAVVSLAFMTTTTPPDAPDATSPNATEESTTAAASSEADAAWMQRALEEARAAASEHADVPVGAVAVLDGELIARGRNRREQNQDPTAHAEIEVVREAARALGHWRLGGVTVYVTLEPCAMCAGALVLARVARVVYGCTDPKAGAVDSLFAIGKDARLNHRFEVVAGVRADEASSLLKGFFAARRPPKKTPGAP